jgi:4-amino-4-deoxy-L-arabinose transferase-like glycosyltransferase
VFAVFYFPHVYYATIFDSENLFALCIALGLWLFLKHLRDGSLPSLAGAGLALGWGALTRPFALLLLPLLVIVLAYAEWRDRRMRPVAVLVLVAGFFAVVLPWTIRNYAVHKKFVLIATNGGSTFYGGNNDVVLREPRHWGGWVTTKLLPGRDLIDAAPDEVSHDKVEWRLGFQWMRENAASLPRLWSFKFARFWLPDVDSGNKKYVALQLLSYTPFLLLYVVGAVCYGLRREYRTPAWMSLHGTILMTVLTALLFWGSPRFRDANAPVLMVYASLGASMVWSRLRRRKQSDPTISEPA